MTSCRGSKLHTWKGRSIYPSSTKETLERMQNFVIPRRAHPPWDRGGLLFTTTSGRGQGGLRNPGSGKLCYQYRGNDHLITDCTHQVTQDDASTITVSLATANTTVNIRGGPPGLVTGTAAPLTTVSAPHEWRDADTALSGQGGSAHTNV